MSEAQSTLCHESESFCVLSARDSAQRVTATAGQDIAASCQSCQVDEHLDAKEY